MLETAQNNQIGKRSQSEPYFARFPSFISFQKPRENKGLKLFKTLNVRLIFVLVIEIMAQKSELLKKLHTFNKLKLVVKRECASVRAKMNN